MSEFKEQPCRPTHKVFSNFMEKHTSESNRNILPIEKSKNLLPTLKLEYCVANFYSEEARCERLC